MIIAMQIIVFSAKIASGKHYGATWQDKVRTDWSLSDPQLSLLAAQEVEKDINNVSPRQIILVTHVVTHPQFVVPTPHRILTFQCIYWYS